MTLFIITLKYLAAGIVGACIGLPRIKAAVRWAFKQTIGRLVGSAP